ncbi:MFS transporter [Weissella koreensis]|uniref:MFS transporter n=1 Tax=Weissella koreensis TaxID=165096 RepID=A0A7H1ML01_9LACO|nr:MFS transporter [Weissella koreensis]AEJ23292.1 multidrug resistance protein B [Weissella koreensis KACC 15510]AVH74934.1 MFS transporter [Weissella koreensis]MCZ9310797.1 MFS transporter [Weissella koreensis]QGN20158.1 MFS transporter [Weissella koreensis]QNT64137.1 MFS transporter [Weissella koreensis]
MTKKANKFGVVLFIILFSYFLILMDNSIIFTSTVKIAQDLHMDQVTLSWISNAYTITFGSFLLLAGRLGDLIGRKMIFMIGLLIFGLSSMMIGLTDSALMMMIFRAIQGIGSAIIAPTSLALLMDYYEGQMRMRAISYYGATAGIGSSFGLLLGGWLTSAISWRAGFLINVPFAAFLLILTLFKIENTTTIKRQIDYVGAILSVLMAAIFVYGITSNNLMLIIISLIIAGGFVYYENKISYALIPMSLFNNRIRSGSYIVRFLFMMAMLTYWFILPQIMQNMYHFTPLQSGMGFLPLTIVNFLAALYLPRLTNKLGNKKVMLLGQSILLLGMVISLLIDPKAGYLLTMGLPMILIGLGQGWLLAPLTAAGVTDVSAEQAGAASGMTNVAHQLGGPVGLSIVVMFSSSITDMSQYYQVVMAFISVFSLIGLLIIILMNKNKK